MDELRVASLDTLDERRHSRGYLRRLRAVLADGERTTVHVASYARSSTRLRVARLVRPEPLPRWCERNQIADCMAGGFFARARGVPLGELRIGGVPLAAEPFAPPWHQVRSCVHAVGASVVVARRDEIGLVSSGDLLQAGPLLVRDGQPCLAGDPEGFSAAHDQFDTDITRGRYPRAALGLDAGGRLVAVVCEGRSETDAGLALAELADTLVALGAVRAINLDGGASAALVCNGRLRNVPRSDDGPIPNGRAAVTALVFAHP